MHEHNTSLHILSHAIINGYLPFCDRVGHLYSDGTNNGLLSQRFPDIWAAIKPDTLLLIHPLWVNGLSIENGIRTKLLHPFVNSGQRIIIPYTVLKDDLYLGMIPGMHVHVQLYSINKIIPC